MFATILIIALIINYAPFQHHILYIFIEYARNSTFIPMYDLYQHLPTGLRHGGRVGKALTGFNW